MTESEPRVAAFSVDAALTTIEQVSGFTGPARRRAEGVTIALWGFVTTALLLTSEVLNLAYGFIYESDWRRWVVMFMWIPWGSVGAIGTIAVWRIAEVSAHTDQGGRRSSWRWLAVWATAVVAIIIVPENLLPIAPAGFYVVALGFLWLGVGAVKGSTSTGRITVLTVGSILVLTGIVFGMTITRLGLGEGFDHFTMVATVAGGFVPIVAGLIQAMRG